PVAGRHSAGEDYIVVSVVALHRRRRVGTCRRAGCCWPRPPAAWARIGSVAGVAAMAPGRYGTSSRHNGAGSGDDAGTGWGLRGRWGYVVIRACGTWSGGLGCGDVAAGG